MKIIEKIQDVRSFGLYRGEEFIALNDRILIGNREMNVMPNEDCFCHNDVLTKGVYGEGTNKKHYLYSDGKFLAEECRYEDFVFFSPDSYYSSVYKCDEKKEYFSFIENGQEYLFSVDSDAFFYNLRYNKRNSILLLPKSDNKSILFYSRDGNLLWKYNVERQDVSIGLNGTIEDEDFVIICCYTNELEKYSVECFNIKTGEKIWGIYGNDIQCGSSYKLGPKGMLYGLSTIWNDKAEIVMECIALKNGERMVIDIKGIEDSDIDIDSSRSTIYGNMLYFNYNRPVPTIASIDLGTMCLVEELKIKTSKYARMGDSPIVTEDKVYQYITSMRELHVYSR